MQQANEPDQHSALEPDGSLEGTVATDPMADGDQYAYEDMQVLAFGLMDPCDWAATLSNKLSAATQILHAAREHHGDSSKDIEQSTDAEALAGIRAGVSEYLTELYVMLHSMPMMQRQPHILEALGFILSGLEDIDRGAAPDWLRPLATKRHSKSLENENEWVPIIAALELLRLGPQVNSVDAAAKKIHGRTGRAISTIKYWHRQLYHDGKRGRATARTAIQSEIGQMRQLVKLANSEDRSAIIARRVDELLA